MKKLTAANEASLHGVAHGMIRIVYRVRLVDGVLTSRDVDGVRLVDVLRDTVSVVVKIEYTVIQGNEKWQELIKAKIANPAQPR